MSWQTFRALTNRVLWGNCSWTSTSPQTARDCSPNLVFCSDSRLWCVPVLASLTLQPPAIIYVLYCEGVNKSATAPLSVPSVSETSALAFCSVIYARLLPKMSFLSPTAPSACERAWHLSVFINFKDAFACFLSFTLLVFFIVIFYHYLFVFFFSFLSKICCSFTHSVSLSLSFSLSGLNTSGVTCSLCLYSFPFSFVVTLLYKRISKGNILSRVTLYCTLDTGKLRIYSVLRSFSFVVRLHITGRITVWYVDEPISLDLSQLEWRFVPVFIEQFCWFG